MSMSAFPFVNSAQQGAGGAPSFFTAPIRFVDTVLEVTGVNAAYGTDFSMTFQFGSFESRTQVSKDAGGTAGVWTIGGADAPIGPDMPQWHDQYPIANQQNLYEAAFIETESWSGLTDGLADFRWAGFPNPASGDWRNPGAFCQAGIVENPGGVPHTSEHIGIYEIRRVSDDLVLARARVTLRVIYT